MYGRMFRSVSALSKNVKLHYDCIIKSNVGIVNTVGALKYCTTIAPDKNKIGEARLAAYRENPDNDKHLKILELEVEVMRQSGYSVPDNIAAKHWVELIEIGSRTKRRKYLEFLFGIERKRVNQLKRKEEKREIRLQAFKEERENCVIPEYLQYRLGQNSPFLRFYDSTMQHHQNWRLMRAMMYGQKLIFDCGYEDKMNRIEKKNCAKQLMLAFAANRAHIDPFDLHFCNFDPEGEVHLNFHSFIPTMYEPDFPLNITSKSYLDIFDRNQLIYLTPHCNTEIGSYDPNMIYIVGAIVDKHGAFPVSMAKAKREGIRMGKLPIDRYLSFGGGGHKSLTLNQMIAIMLDVKDTNDWPFALRHVPRRKLMESRQKALQRKLDHYSKMNEEEKNVVYSEAPQDFTARSANKFSAK